MTRRDAFDADLVSVFDDEARAPIPAGGLERLHAAIANEQPRHARVAGLGGRWISDPGRSPSPLGALRAGVPVLRFSGAVLLLLLTLAFIGAAALVGGRLLDRPPGAEKLLYELDGVIYLAEADGSDPTRVADGHLSQTIAAGSVWSPDGQLFLYDDDGRTKINNASGSLVSSSEVRWGLPYWSPDSSRLQAWIASGTGIAVHGIDGELQASLALPAGYGRLYETEGVWAPDGQSVWVQIAREQTYPCTSSSTGPLTELDPPRCTAREVWQLPIDGSTPRQLAVDHPFARAVGAFSRDGRRVAYVTQPLTAATADLVVANADGSDARTVATGRDLSGFLEWSPDGERLAYFASQGGRVDLMVLEVATGTVFTAVSDFSRDGYPPFSWSSASNKLLFSAPGEGGETSLWSVNVDGTGRTLLVQGATWGAMPPAGRTHSWDGPPGEGEGASPSPVSTPLDAGVRPEASLIRIAGHDLSIVLPDALGGRLPLDGDSRNGIGWGNNDDEVGHTGSRWTSWYLYAPDTIDDPDRRSRILPLPSDPVAWLRQLPASTVIAERDIEVGGQPAQLLDIARHGRSGGFMFQMPVGTSGASGGFMNPGGTHIRIVIWQLGQTWMVAQATAEHLGALQSADAPDDPFMQFIADLRFP